MAPEERRGAILEAALSVFSDLGYTQATLNDVADRVGVTKGCLYHYFESKERLLLDLIQDRIGAGIIADAALASGEGTREELLREFVERLWQRFQQPGQIEVAILALTELPKIPEAGRMLHEEVLARSEQTLREMLHRGGGCDCDDVPAEEIRRGREDDSPHDPGCRDGHPVVPHHRSGPVLARADRPDGHHDPAPRPVGRLSRPGSESAG